MSAQHASAISPSETNYLTTDGETVDLTFEEFEARPDTPAIDDLAHSDYDCCVCEDTTLYHPRFERSEC